MIYSDSVTSLILYAMGADEASLKNRTCGDLIKEMTEDSQITMMRNLCKVRSAIMLRSWKSLQQGDYPMQQKICPEETYKQVVAILKPKIGYIKDTDFTNPTLYDVFTAANKMLFSLADDIIERYDFLRDNKYPVKRFIVSNKQLRFQDFLTELKLVADTRASLPWGIYSPMWYKLYQDNKGNISTLFMSDSVFLPKIHYSSGRYYHNAKKPLFNTDGCTPSMRNLLDIIKDSRNVSVIVDGDNVQSLQLMVLLKFLSPIKNVKAIKVAYSEEVLVRWENIRIDKVAYYKSRRYCREKNNTDLLVGALMIEECYKGASTVILVSSDGDYINIIDLIHNSEVIVIQCNDTSESYLSDLKTRGVHVQPLKDMFTDEQVKQTVLCDKRMQAIFTMSTF